MIVKIVYLTVTLCSSISTYTYSLTRSSSFSAELNGTESKSKELSSIHDSVEMTSNKFQSENIPSKNPPPSVNGVVKKEPLAASASSSATSGSGANNAALPTPASKPAPSAQSREKAASYLTSVKKNLKDNVSAYQRFTAALKKYQKENQYEELTQVLVDVFLSRDEWHHLLRGFYHFLRNNHKAEFNELCFNLTGQRCENAT